jgi:hypothetical protein
LYRPEAQVKLLRISLASLAACAALAAPAHAETGNGLYEPFPSPSHETLAHDFVDALPGGVAFTDLRTGELRRGVLVGPSAAAAYRAGSAPVERARSGVGFAPSFGWPLAIVLLAGVFGGAALLRSRQA